MSTRIVISAGGTGGHMFPAASVAENLRLMGYKIILITDTRGMRFAKDFADDIILELPVANIRQGGIKQRMSGAFLLVKSIWLAWKKIRTEKAVAVVGFGGYPSFPAVLAGFLTRKKLFIHEQNAILGRTNKFLKALTGKIFTSFEKTISLTNNARIIHTGNPVRPQIIRYAGSKLDGFENGFKILVTGGSQGAKIFSDVLPNVIEFLPKDLKQKLYIVHQARPEEVKQTKQRYQDVGVKVSVVDFIQDMGAELQACHLVICRSGASTLAEVNLIGRPAIYVPLPSAADDQQTINANYSVSVGAARLVRQDDFTPTLIASILTQYYTNPQKLHEMAEKAFKMGLEQAGYTIAYQIKSSLQAS